MYVQIEMTLGNAAMQTPIDVAGALKRTASALEDSATADVPIEPGHEGRWMGIRDLNGNTVGALIVKKEADDV